MCRGVQYADETAYLYARELLDGATAEMTVAVVSTPSVFVALKNILVRPSLRFRPCMYLMTDIHIKVAAPPSEPKPKLVLLEHDRRFAIFPEFVFYDFAQPLKLPGLPPPPVCHPTLY